MHIYVSIPAMDELHYLPECLNSIKQQTYKDYTIFICINQPDNWWERSDKKHICINNQKTIQLFQKKNNLSINIIDKSSKGNGWNDKKHCVGQARKILMDTISERANDNDIIVSLDADTTFTANYFQSIVDCFTQYPEAKALSNPYYHKLTDDDINNRAILRYEIYLRYYILNLWRIGSPYVFTPLGSAFALPVSVYKTVKGISPKMSGEDFYFLQKIRKYGKILNHNNEVVNPSCRLSDRVFFGTGPALIKGVTGDWNSYPIFDHTCFDMIADTYKLFPKLYAEDVPTPMSDFLMNHFKVESIWKPLRDNFRNENDFVKACYQKVDGLRIFQFLRHQHQKNYKKCDEINLINYLNTFYKNQLSTICLKNLTFENTEIEVLDHIRNFLFEKEKEYQNKFYTDNSVI